MPGVVLSKSKGQKIKLVSVYILMGRKWPSLIKVIRCYIQLVFLKDAC